MTRELAAAMIYAKQRYRKNRGHRGPRHLVFNNC
jgi:hypothetical protein